MPWVPAVQKDARARNAHASTAIEGNPLTLAEVRALADHPESPQAVPRSRREVVNYFAGLRYLERHVHEHPIESGPGPRAPPHPRPGRHGPGPRGGIPRIEVNVGDYFPPRAADVPELMSELLDWWNGPADDLSPAISSAILHYRFEAIHPFGDVNGRVGRALALWELYRRGFDTHHIFSVDEYYWEDWPAYYAALRRVRLQDEDLTSWLEYCATGLLQTLEQVWQRIQTISPAGSQRLVLSAKQERLLQLLGVEGSMAPSQIWAALGVSRQGAMNVINPLIDAGVIEKVGTKKSGRYVLKGP